MAPNNDISKPQLIYNDELGSLKTEYDDEWLSTEEAATYLKTTVGHLRNLTSNGKVPHYKFGRRNLYRLEELRQLLLAQPRGERNVEV